MVNFRRGSEDDEEEEEEDPDLAKIKKVQSFFRGWLCRFYSSFFIICEG